MIVDNCDAMFMLTLQIKMILMMMKDDVDNAR